MLSVIRTVIVAYPGVIASHDEMRAAVVLTHDSMEDRFMRTSVAHGCRQHAEHHPIVWIVILQQHFVTTHAESSRDIILLGIADQGMQVQSIYCLQGALLNIV